MAQYSGLKIFSGSSNQDLAKEICKYIKVTPGDITMSRFPDGEIKVKINESVRGTDAFVIQSTSHPVNENLMELLLIIDALKRASAERITAVIPYYGYARQDRKDEPRVAISSKLVANLVTAAGAHRVLTMDLHAPQLQGFFDIPVDHLIASPVLAGYIKKKKLKNLVVAATDVGGVRMARHFAKKLNCPFAVVDKRRASADKIEEMTIVGDVKGKNILIPDDMITTAGTLIYAVNSLKQKGAKDIYACCTHGVLCGPAVEKINHSALKEVVITNTIPFPKEKHSSKIKILSVASIFGESIKSIHCETSVSSLFQ